MEPHIVTCVKMSNYPFLTFSNYSPSKKTFSFHPAEIKVINDIKILLSAQHTIAQRALDRQMPTIIGRTCSFGFNIHEQLKNCINASNDLIGNLGILPAFINVDASTKILHTERDTTYTIISVPKQEKNSLGIHFQFCLTKATSLFLNMQSLTTFAYSAFFLTHRQNHDSGHNNINISSYGSQRLFFNARKSIERINCNLTTVMPSDENLDQQVN